MSPTVVTSSLWVAAPWPPAASSRSRWERSTSSRGSPWRPRGSRQRRRSPGLSLTGRDTARCAFACKLWLPQGRLMASEGVDGEVDDLGEEVRQAVGLAVGDLVEDQDLGLPEGEARVAVRADRSVAPGPQAFDRRDHRLAVALDH